MPLSVKERLVFVLLFCLFIFTSCKSGELKLQTDTSSNNGDTDSSVSSSDTDSETCSSGITCGQSDTCCLQDEECVNDWLCLPKCDNIRCGANLSVCCDVGQICLNGVDCSADCKDNQTLCGENLDTCCKENYVCLDNKCLEPGKECSNNFDCRDDKWYCEKIINKCLPLPEGELCEGEPVFTDIDPALEWSWPGVTYNNIFYENSMTSPMVGDVNGDGIPDVVVVLFEGSNYQSPNLIAVLSGAGDGLGKGELLFTIPSANDPEAPWAMSASPVALANFDDDPGLEIVYCSDNFTVIIADNDGVGDVCDEQNYPGCSGRRENGGGYGGVTVVDLDHDGMPDIVSRCRVFNGHNIGDSGMDFLNRSCGCSVVSDLDEDGRPEVTDGVYAYTVDPALSNGEDFWSGGNILTAGFAAVADIFPGISGPEVVLVQYGFSIVNGQTGAVLAGEGGSLLDALIPIPGNGKGGAPIVADFDGDGLPEIGTAGLAAYVVYDPDCWDPPLRTGGACVSGRTDFVLWTTPTQDLSSSSTGSSVFDFQGDGAAEVLYADECFFHIYDGLTGQELVDPPLPSSSGTINEYPLVADVDGDGNAEMLVVSSEYYVYGGGCDVAWIEAGLLIDSLCEITTCVPGTSCDGGIGGTCSDSKYLCDANGTCQRPGGTRGVRVYGDRHDSWVKTRPVWNQFTYHVTDFTMQGGSWNVPKNEVPNWTVFNNFRQNVQGGALFPVPNLKIKLIANNICPKDVYLVATVSNEGSAGVPAAVKVNFYRTDEKANNPPELVGSAVTNHPLLPGEWERVTITYQRVNYSNTMEFMAVVDDEENFEECIETDNSATDDVGDCLVVE